MIIKTIRFLKRIRTLNFILVGIGAVLLTSIIFGLFSNGSGGNPLLLKNKYYAFVIGVLIAPFIETIIFQTIPFYFINKFIKHKKKFYILVFISPILFIHTFNISYMFISYLVGIILMFMYYVAYYRKENAIILIFAIHFINNLLAHIAHFS